MGSILFFIVSVILVFALIYFYGDGEDKALVDSLPVLGAVGKWFAGVALDAERVWYINVLVCVGVLYLVPFAASFVIWILVTILGGGKAEETPLEAEAGRAKRLAEISKQANSLVGFKYKSSAWRILCNWLFTLIVCGSFLFVAYKMKMITVSFCIGLAAVAVVMHLLYKLLLGISTAINGVFYKFNSSEFSMLSNLADAYWVRVDPEEAKRREEEKARAAAAFAAKVAERERKRKQALESEKNGRYADAKALFYQAAQLGDALAMENYARHCLIAGDRSSAIYWMEKCVATGEADATSRELLNAMKEGKHINAHYGFD